jgi:hypothetical protein
MLYPKNIIFRLHNRIMYVFDSFFTITSYRSILSQRHVYIFNMRFFETQHDLLQGKKSSNIRPTYSKTAPAPKLMKYKAKF